MSEDITFVEEAKIWHGRSFDLTKWTRHCLLNRDDAWGKYTPVARRGTTNKRTGRIIGSSFTESKQRLGTRLIARHFQCRAPEHVIGLMAISLENTCRWIVIDIDAHAAEVPADVRSRNLAFALHLWNELRALGFHPLLTDSNRRGGYHIRIVFATPIPASVAFRFAKSIIQGWSEWGFDEQPEVFPKRPDRNSTKGFGGGWVRLLGRHHTRNVMVLVWDGEVWLFGHKAIDTIVATTGDDPSLIPEALLSEPAPVVVHDTRHPDCPPTNIVPSGHASLQPITLPAHPDHDARIQVAWSIVNSHPIAISGERGHDTCFHLACLLVLGCGLTLPEALPLLHVWNERCLPPWTDAELIHKLTDADRKPGDRGYLVSPTRPIAVAELPHVDNPIAPLPRLTLTEFRDQMAVARQQSLDCKGQVFLDRSPTGTGKTSADIQSASEVSRHGGRSLFVAPVHDNCNEIKRAFDAVGVPAEVFPARITQARIDVLTRELADDSPVWESLPEANCWDEGNAERAQAMGLPVGRTVCFGGCPFLKQCRLTGYLHDLEQAQQADVGVVTHKRGEHQGLASLSDGREFVAIHEDPTGLFRPTDTIAKQDVLVVQSLLNEMLNNPNVLNSQWFNPTANSPPNEQQIPDRISTANDIYSFLLHLSRTVDHIVDQLEQVERTIALHKPFPLKRPNGLERLLFRFCHESGTQFAGAPWRGLLAWAAGEAAELVIMVSCGQSSSKTDIPSAFHKTVMVSWQNLPASESTVWIGDSTADAELLQLLLPGRTIHDATPHGALERQKHVIQIPRDISRKTSPKTVRQIVRGLIYQRPHTRRVGIICHSTHKKAVTELQDEFADRIARVTYFGRGDERSSNLWSTECDFLICIGTPRPGQDEVRRRLVQLGLLEDAGLDVPEWSDYAWTGYTETGQEVRVRTKGYAQNRWQQVFKSMCCAELVQCVGRSRALLQSGIDMVVVSAEPLRLPITVSALPRVSDTAGEIVATIRLMTSPTVAEDHVARVDKPLKINACFPYNIYRESKRCAADIVDLPISVSTSQIAEALDLSSSRVRAELNLLCSVGAINKVGERSGWCLPNLSPPDP